MQFKFHPFKKCITIWCQWERPRKLMKTLYTKSTKCNQTDAVPPPHPLKETTKEWFKI